MPNAEHEDTSKIFHLRPLVVIACGFALGILVMSYLSPVLALIIIVFALASVFFLRKRLLIVLLIISFSLGASRTMLALPNQLDNGYYNVTARVHDISSDKRTIYLTSLNINGKRVSGLLKAKYIKGLAIDDVISSRCNVSYTVNLGRSSYKYYLYSENITATANNISSVQLLSHTLTPNGCAKAMRNAVSVKIYAMFGESAPIICGILLGDTALLDNETISAVRIAGTAHLLALSGLHVSILCAFLVRFFPIHGKLRVFCILGFLLFYCTITGFPASLVRAGLMYFAMELTWFKRKIPDRLSTLAFAAVIILFVQPFQLFSVGFLMSFCTFIGIICIGSRITFFIEQRLGPYEFIKAHTASLITGFSATMGILPVNLTYFNTFCVYSIPANVVLIPIAGFGVLFAFIAVVTGFIFEPLGKLVAFIPRAIFIGFTFACKCIASLPAAVLPARGMSAITWIFYYAAIVMFSLYNLSPQKIHSRKSVVYFCLAMCFFTYIIT